MKKTILLLAAVAINYIASAQAPQGIPYQAVLRDATGNIIASNATVQVEFIIHDGGASGTSLYDQTVTAGTNQFGQMTTTIGTGGTTNSGNFGTINWASGGKWLEVKVNTGSGFVAMGTNQLYSVPYALNQNGGGAGSVPNGSVTGNTMHWDGLAWVQDNTLYNNGTKIGIGTTTPEFKLSLDNDAGIIAKGIYPPGVGATLSTSGAGTRMFWYPRNAAFRAGSVSGSQWDDNNNGYNSFAAGFDVKASGSESVAMGGYNTASGTYSVAMGNNSTASGSQAIAIGGSTTSSGNTSFSSGYNTTASGTASTAMGNFAVASGSTSFSIGNHTTASGEGTIAMGSFVSTNSHSGSMIIGDNSLSASTSSASDNSFTSRYAGGYSLFSDAATTTGNGLFFVNGNLGLGANNPATKLDVNGTVTIRGGSPAIGSVLTSTDAIGTAAWAPGFAAGTAAGNTPYWNSTAWVNSSNIFNNNANVGIGTNTPASKLDVTDAAPELRISNTSTGGVGSSRLSFISNKGTATPWRPGYIDIADNGGYTGRLDFFTNGAGAGNAMGSTLAMSVVNGTVGIGTSSPSSTLDVAAPSSELRISNTSAGGIGSSRLSFISNKGTGLPWRPGYIDIGDNGGYTGRLDFFTNGAGAGNAMGSTLAMSVANGKVGIGTSAPQATLDVNGGMKYATRGIGSPSITSDLTITDNDNVIIYGGGSSLDPTYNCTGIISPSNFVGKIIHIVNTTSHDIVLKGASSSSSGTQFYFGYSLGPLDRTIGSFHSITLIEVSGGTAIYWADLSN